MAHDPKVTWRNERAYFKELYFFKRRFYITVNVGIVKAKRKPVEHRQPPNRQRSLLMRLLA